MNAGHRGIFYDFITSTCKPLSQFVEVCNGESRMRLSRGYEILRHAKVNGDPADREPTSPTCRQRARLSNFPEAEEGAVKRSGLILLAGGIAS